MNLLRHARISLMKQACEYYGLAKYNVNKATENGVGSEWRIDVAWAHLANAASLHAQANAIREARRILAKAHAASRCVECGYSWEDETDHAPDCALARSASTTNHAYPVDT